MIIYYIYIIYCSLISFLVKSTKQWNYRKILAFILWFGLFLVMALRSETVGNDLIRYLDHYKYIGDVSIFQTQTEMGYMIFEKVLNYFAVGRQGYIVIVSFIISTSFAWFFYKYSKNITFSFLLHFTIGLFSFTMTGIRQSLAIAITLFALHFAIRRKIIWFLFFTFLAITFHRSAFVFLPVYWILGISFKSYKPIVLFIFSLLVLVFINQYLFSYLGDLSVDDYSQDYQAYLDASDKSSMNVLAVAFKIIYPLSIVFFWILQKKKIFKVDKNDLSFFALALVSAVFAIFSLNLSKINRFSYYFVTSTFALIPNTICDFKKRSTREILQFLFLVICIIYFIMATIGGRTKIDDYIFF